jgi:hypothetical protein
MNTQRDVVQCTDYEISRKDLRSNSLDWRHKDKTSCPCSVSRSASTCSEDPSSTRHPLQPGIQHPSTRWLPLSRPLVGPPVPTSKPRSLISQSASAARPHTPRRRRHMPKHTLAQPS